MPPIKKPLAPKKKIATDPTIPFRRRIEELEAEKLERLEEQMLMDEVSWRKELLTALNRIANALESSDQVGDENPLDDQGYGAVELPDPETAQGEF